MKPREHQSGAGPAVIAVGLFLGVLGYVGYQVAVLIIGVLS